MKLNYLVPVYNEKETVKRLIEKLLALPADKDIIVVDDGSTDGTGGILSSLSGIRVIRHESNRGKGAAIITAIDEIKEGVIIIQDADLELEPAETLDLVKGIKNREKDVVFGTRLKGHFAFTLGFACNKMLAVLTNILFGSHLTDVMTCYKIMDVRILKALDLQSMGFDVETEITAKLLSSGYNIIEAPISYKVRTKKEGKKIRFRDSFGIIYTLIRARGKV